MTLVEHLTELRKRLIIAIVSVALCAIVGFLLYNRVLHFLQTPYCNVHDRHPKLVPSCRLLVTDPLEPFAIRLKVATYFGLMIAAPIVLWQLWRFITPGLHKNEKRYAIPFILSSILLFAGGAVVAWLTFPKALDFLLTIGGQSLTTQLRPTQYLRLILLMMVAFGVAFEFPVVLVFLEIANVLTPKKLKSWRRPAIVVIFIVAAVITPSQDPYSLFAMAIPMCVFYEASILVGRLLKK